MFIIKNSIGSYKIGSLVFHYMFHLKKKNREICTRDIFFHFCCVYVRTRQTLTFSLEHTSDYEYNNHQMVSVHDGSTDTLRMF